MELTKEQQAKVFALYLGCKFKDYGIDEEEDNIGELIAVNSEGFCTDEYGNIDIPFKAIKLLLRPLSSITDKELVEVAAIHYGYNIDTAPNRKHLLAYVKKWLPDNIGKHYQMSMWGISHHFAIPLFIAIGNPLNGKNAVEIGIAEYITT